MKFILLPAGEFQMGSPGDEEDARDDDRPPHAVRITNRFYIGIYEVTQKQWQAVMHSQPWANQDFAQEGGDYPATYVSWDDATSFCRALGVREGKTYRLPTEAEWEYACRAGTATKCSFGDDPRPLIEHAWFIDNTVSVGECFAHRVGRKRANPWGLYDMHGNVWEWCSDWYDTRYYEQSPTADPTGPAFGADRVHRGGGCGTPWFFCRSATRGGSTPGSRGPELGFRVTLVP